MTESDQEKAEVLNDFFASVFTRENQDEMPTMNDKEFDKPLNNITINTGRESLKRLNPGKSMGPDEINHYRLKPRQMYFQCLWLSSFKNLLVQEQFQNMEGCSSNATV